MMTRIDVDYNERDEDGRVVTRVPSGLFAGLQEGQSVSLYDPVDRLWADASVAWLDRKTGAAGFDVNWQSFVDDDLDNSQESARHVPVDYHLTGQSFTSELMVVLVLQRLEDNQGLLSSSTRHYSFLYRALLGFRSRANRTKDRKPLVCDYSIQQTVKNPVRRSSSTLEFFPISAEWEIVKLCR
jgi:hypothetical protein